jgi:hypothetical protein
VEALMKKDEETEEDRPYRASFKGRDGVSFLIGSVPRRKAVYTIDIIDAQSGKGGFLPLPTPPCMRVRTGRFTEITGLWPGS